MRLGQPVRISGQEFLYSRQREQDLFQLHLIADASRSFSVVLEELKSFRGLIRIEPAVNTQRAVTWIDSSHLLFERGKAQQLQEFRISECLMRDLLKGEGHYLSRVFDLFIMFATDNVRAEKRSSRTIAMKQPQLFLRFA